MRNKFLSCLFLIVSCLLGQTFVSANTVELDVAEIIFIDDEGIIKASNGVAKSIKDNIEINAQEFIYNKNLSIINATKNVKIIDYNRNIEIRSENIIYDINGGIIEISNNASLIDIDKNIKVESQNITYDIVNKIIKSDVPSIITDSFDNIIHSSSFNYNIGDGLIKINKSKFTDSQKNIFQIETGYLNLKSNKLIAKDIMLKFNAYGFNKGNEPRLKGRTLSIDENNSVFTKGVFTLCKKNDSCPPWQIYSENIRHDRKKKIMFYKNAWLKLYDKPVFYFPKFFHPDPSVKRQSGFLMPSFVNSSSVGTSINTPYFKVLSDNKDLTLNPRFYSSKKLMLQSEYRQVEKNSKYLLDFSFLRDSASSMKGHFFAKTNKTIDFLNFDESELFLNLQQSSHNTYLKAYDLKSPIIRSANILESSLKLAAYSENTSLDTKISIYEDLSKNDNDKFEYVYPSYNLTKIHSLDGKTNSNFTIISSGYVKNYNTNIYEKILINDFLLDSKDNFSKIGFKNDYNILLKNVNSDGEKSSNYKDDIDNTLGVLFEFNSTYPLIKKTVSSYNDIIKPKISLRYSPNHTKNMKNESRRLNVDNVYSLNRIGKDDTLEAGGSLTYGIDYAKINPSNNKIFEARFANVLRLEQNNNLSNTSGLNKKTSDFLMALKFRPNENLKFNYDFSIDENLANKKYEFLETEFKVNNFVTSFDYLNENNSNNTSYVGNKTSYLLNKDSKIMFSTRENKKTKFTEFVNLLYEYSNDCLKAGIEYNKNYYSDRDLKPDESIFFKLTIIPFGQTSSPNLKK